MQTSKTEPVNRPHSEPSWLPDPRAVAKSHITDFSQYVSARGGYNFSSYNDLWSWSIDRQDEFWSAVWDFFDITSDTAYTDVLIDSSMPGARWFPGTRLNYAEHSLRSGEADDFAVITISEDGTTAYLTWGELRRSVGALAHWLRNQGVGIGDRVVGYLPNTSHAVVAFLATASLGAIWSACGQDYSASGAAARLAQLAPAVLFAGDGYQWNGRPCDRRSEVAELQSNLPTLRATVLIPNLDLSGDVLDAVPWEEACGVDAELVFTRVDFDTPLWVLFSSGTTGLPKGIVHGHGGILVDHYRLHGLHNDLHNGDRFFWYTTTNWMMWNVTASALLLGASIIVYDGSPTFPNARRLWEIAADHNVDVLGVSPGHLTASAKSGVEPLRDLDLSRLRTVASTGAPLPAQCYDWVRDHVGARIQLASTTGGTDIASGFAGSAPNTPVWAGQLSAPMLGVALDSWDENGNSVVDEVGELVVTKPLPSMPLRFWNDPDGSRYHDAYFDMYPGVWRHGDWITISSVGSVSISGRSDSTLNRFGVRLGSADIYDVVEAMPEIREALVVGAELPDHHYWMPLFVVMEPGIELDDALKVRISSAIRTQASPRHVPDEIIAVPAVPHTRTGKKLEVPIKRILQGTPIDRVVNLDTIDNPAALDYFSQNVAPTL